MRLLVTADTLGGVWSYTRELVTHLLRRQHEVVLVSFGALPTAGQTEWMQGLSNLDFRPTAYKLEWMRDSRADLKQSEEFLQEVIAETKPDLLHLNQYCYGAMPSEVPKIVVAHSDVVSWWAAVHGHEPLSDPWINSYREIVAAGIAGADVVVGVTAWMLQQITRHYGAPQHGTVVHNGRSPELFSPSHAKEHFALTAGRLWDEAKQVSLLSEINLPLPVVIVGEQRHPDSVSQSQHNKKQQIKFLGQQSEDALREIYARASIYIATSRYEPFGLAPLEAALSGCAVLANGIASLREVWGNAALYFSANDAQDLQRQLGKLSASPSLCEEYARRAFQRATALYSAQCMTGNYSELYQSLGAGMLLA